MMHVYYVPGMQISPLHSLYHLIFQFGTTTPILQMETVKVEEFSKLNCSLENGLESMSL